MRGVGSVLVGVLVISCAPSGPATLKLTSAQRSVRANGATSRVQIVATMPLGLIGQGRVTVKASPGQPADDVELTLDAYGTASIEASCDVAVDSRCGTSPRFTVVASWSLNGSVVTGEAVILLEAPPPSTETVCDNRDDEDEDGLTDCADPDCAALACTDGDPCTTGERCAGTACSGGGPVACNTPPSPSCSMAIGTCMPGVGCIYPAINVGQACSDGNACTSTDRCTSSGTCAGMPVSCPSSNNPCKLASGTCNPMSGVCEYGNRPNGTSCGTAAADRCCNGICADISRDEANCGGCGFVCGSSQLCYDAVLGVCPPAFAVSGRCSCSAESDCPPDTNCKNNRCEPENCKPGQGLEPGSGTSCLAYCRY